jgi:hypothetical protein
MIKTQIEIEASPEEVRNTEQQFFDFEHWLEMGSDLMRSITRLPSNPGGPMRLLCWYVPRQTKKLGWGYK